MRILRLRRRFVATLLPLLTGCALGVQTGLGDAPPEERTADPFAPMEDRSEGLTNTSTDLMAVLENGSLPGACAAWAADPGNRKKKLLCGKSMFFYESYSTLGVPAPLVDFLIANFPEEVGAGFSEMGMVPDPTSEAGLPLGFTPTAPINGQVASYAYTCASCHFERMPDGRYGVGAANHAFDYGRQMLSFVILPGIATMGGAENHDPSAVAAIQPLLDRFDAEPSLKWQLVGALLPMLGAGAGEPEFPLETERHYAQWKTGTMDFTIEPLFLNDGVHTVTKIPTLWGIPDPEEVAATGMETAMLGWSGTANSMLDFARSFVAWSGGDVEGWPDSRLEPLVEYVHSLAPPPAPSSGEALVAKGRETFSAAGCLDCHAGPRGSGKRTYSFDEVGTDDALAKWMDPDLDGQICCGAYLDGQPMSNGVKSPRLVGLWAMERFLHNGSVPSLEDLLCADGPRGGPSEPAFGDGGHEYGCDLPDDEKSALLAFLRSH